MEVEAEREVKGGRLRSGKKRWWGWSNLTIGPTGGSAHPWISYHPIKKNRKENTNITKKEKKEKGVEKRLCLLEKSKAIYIYK